MRIALTGGHASLRSAFGGGRCAPPRLPANSKSKSNSKTFPTKAGSAERLG